MPTSDYRPSLADVGALLASRTRVDSSGEALGTFTPDTQPTASQVELLIDKAVADLETRIGIDPFPQLAAAFPDPSEFPDSGTYPGPVQLLADAAKNVAALTAAMLIELSFYGDQIAVQRSPYAELKALRDGGGTGAGATQGMLADLLTGIEALGQETGDEDPLAPGGLPSYDFPPIGPVEHVAGSELAVPSTWMDW